MNLAFPAAMRILCTPSSRIVAIGALLLCGVPATGQAQGRPGDLARATLEELLNVRITTASRKEQRAEDVPAAVFVITREDIRRSGLTTLPEILRLVPGMQVAQINANKWAVSVRGFNGLNSNKLLVLLDGRSVYNRAFSGVFWDTQDVLISDIERIEVIRGPGGAMWGANAVNGIINIITRSAADTQGTVVDLSVGTFERDRVSARYGGSLGSVDYRVYSQWSEYADGLVAPRTSADDSWNSLVTGFRADWTRGRDVVMVQSNATNGTTRPNWFVLPSATPGSVASPSNQPSDVDEITALGRWTRNATSGSVFMLQAFHSSTYRDDVLAWNRERTNDIDVQYQTAIASRHDVVVGGGLRHAAIAGRSTLTVSLGSDDNVISSTFLQDEIRLGDSVSLTLGSKLEHDSTAGWGLLPSARAMWHASSNQHVWAGLARARRTPSFTDRAIRVNAAVLPGEPLPILAGYTGNAAFRSEQLVQAEAGYRVHIGSTAEFDVAIFRGQYDHLATREPQAPVFELTPAPAHVFVAAQTANLLSLDTGGIEINGHWAPHDLVRIDGSYSFLHLSPHLDPSSRDVDAATFDGDAPAHQWQVRSSFWLTRRAELNAAFYHVGRLRELDVPAYSRVDARFELKLTARLSALATGQNLSRSAHAEFPGAAVFMGSSLVPRSGRFQLRWQF